MESHKAGFPPFPHSLEIPSECAFWKHYLFLRGIEQQNGPFGTIRVSVHQDVKNSRFYVQVDWICKHWPTFQY